MSVTYTRMSKVPTHLTAVFVAKGKPFELQSRPTPKAGPSKLLIAVKLVALSPEDHIMRSQGFFVPSYPAILGFDISDLVLEVGDDVPTGTTDDGTGLFFQPGITRVAAYSVGFWKFGDQDYGSLPRTVLCSLAACCDKDSSFAAVYATAGLANAKYVASLGADRVFDYRDLQVVDAIVSAAMGDGVVIRQCFLAMGELAPCQAVLKAFLGGDGHGEKKKAKIGSVSSILPGAEVVIGVEAIFVQP